MSRQPRDLQLAFCYHITVRCNNREFRLTRLECREVLLYAIKRCQEKYGFKLYGLCIMSNHVHYLLEPTQPKELPQIMHWLNWYTAMCFNRMLNRTGHFWEKRYHTLEMCAAIYHKFCKKYKPKPKPEKRNQWGSKLLAQIKARSRIKKKVSPGQQSLWEEWDKPAEDIRRVAEEFVLANCFDPKIASIQFEEKN